MRLSLLQTPWKQWCKMNYNEYQIIIYPILQSKLETDEKVFFYILRYRFSSDLSRYMTLCWVNSGSGSSMTQVTEILIIVSATFDRQILFVPPLPNPCKNTFVRLYESMDIWHIQPDGTSLEKTAFPCVQYRFNSKCISWLK